MLLIFVNKKIFLRVNFTLVYAQADWVSNCDANLVSTIQNGFWDNLRDRKSLEEWMEWLEAIVDQILAKYHDKSIEMQVEMSKLFLLKWSFYG